MIKFSIDKNQKLNHQKGTQVLLQVCNPSSCSYEFKPSYNYNWYVTLGGKRDGIEIATIGTFSLSTVKQLFHYSPVINVDKMI